ncbi:MBL fold metallo-hydrolase [Streptomyces blattellae]|uniref:MBL fold metallo-hydrolase n=1 Tax=Streptomyces blattellae TaxID=2569855 RepID=UPI001E55850A|nr:MBL fold metallo-hydrolase [Streptomyces blattellae]
MTNTSITKYAHSCVTLTQGETTLLIDPGAFTPQGPELLQSAHAVLITHDHPDHIDVNAVRAAIDARPELTVYGPAKVAELLSDDDTPGITVVEPGDTFGAAGFEVRAVGGQHAPLHPDMPAMTNVGYLVEDVYHPGDSYDVPNAPVETLLLPTSGPWTVFAQAVDFVRAVRPRQSVQIHDSLLSDAGRQAMTTFLGTDGLTGIPLLTLEPGQTL